MAPRKKEKLSKTANRQRSQTNKALKTKVKDRVLGKGKITGKASKASNRPMMKIKKKLSKSVLSREEARLQKQIEEEGLNEKGAVPAGNISLKKKTQKKFSKGKKEVATKKNAQSTTKIRGGGIIYVSNLPYGFFDLQLMKYFRQFGVVTNVRHVRSERTGRSRGFAYVEFKHKEVAIIAAQAMDQYLTFGKIMKCKFIGYSGALSEKIFSVPRFKPKSCPKVLRRLDSIKQINSKRTVNQQLRRQKSCRHSFNKKKSMLEALGVKLDLKAKVIDPELETIKKESNQDRLVKRLSKASSGKTLNNTKEENSQKSSVAFVNGDSEPSVDDKIVFEADQSDDEIVIKTPPFAKKKHVKITATTPAVKITSAEKQKKAVGKKTPKKTSLESTPGLEKFDISSPAVKTPKSRKLNSGTPTSKTPKKSTDKTPKLVQSESETATPKAALQIENVETPKPSKSVHKIGTPKNPQSTKSSTPKTPKMAKAPTPKTPKMAKAPTPKTPKMAKSSTPKTPNMAKVPTPKTPKVAKALKTPKAEKPVKTPKIENNISEEKKVSNGKRRKSVAGSGESSNLLKKKRLSF